VLHTWTRTLGWHPHVHLLVPGGGLAGDGQTWVPVPRRRVLFLVPVKALSKIFRARFLHLARRALPSVPFPVIPWDKRWVVFAKPTVQGADRVLDYLGRYVQRTALSDHALVATDERSVTFRYRHSRDQTQKMMTLPAEEFLRRLLQHVPPKGFHRVRSFGLLHPAHRLTLLRLKLLLAPRAHAGTDSLPATTNARVCPTCGQPELRLIRRLSAAQCLELAADFTTEQLDPPGLARAPPDDRRQLTAANSS
jgi:hypothetical protein